MHAARAQLLLLATLATAACDEKPVSNVGQKADAIAATSDGAAVSSDGSDDATDDGGADDAWTVEEVAPETATGLETTIGPETAVACATSDDCPNDKPACLPGAGQCVQCRLPGHCPTANSRCVANQCVAPVPCTSSKQCTANGAVCDTKGGYCVDCVDASDCADNQACTAGQCVEKPKPCASSKDCAKMGLVCALGTGCVDCQDDADCGASEFCSANACLPDVCKAGEKGCTDADNAGVCAPNGGSYTKVSCPAGLKCDAGTCAAVVCKPGELTCTGDVVFACNAVGTASQKKEDCAPKGQNCVAGACKTLVCKPGAIECQAGLLATCSGDGLQWVGAACPTAQVCAGGACKPKVCEPASKKCEGFKSALCSVDGTDWAIATDCAAQQQVCDKGACVAKACTPGETQCQAGLLATCNADALGWSAEPCPSGQTCDKSVCVKVICKPNEKSCNGSEVHQCDATGANNPLVVDCAKNGEACEAGVCKTPVCKPGAVLCQGADVATCNAKGLAYDVVPCPAGQACGGGACKPMVCEPNAKLCQGDKLSVCDAVGLSASFGEDCAAGGKVCLDNKCAAVVCKLDTTECQGDLLATCVAKGTQWAKITCPFGQVCDIGLCVPTTCKPGDLSCSGDKLMQCDPKGVAPKLAKDCAATGEVCHQQQCKKPICKAAATECQQGQLATCALNGLSWSQSACPANTACVAGACKAVVCQPNALSCDGDIVRQCDASGTTNPAVQDCTKTFLSCAAGKCVVPICKPGESTCDGPTKTLTCNSNGTTFVAANCGANQVCDKGACKNVVCKANEKTCKGNTIELCDALGTSVSIVTNCGATGQVCDQGLCKNVVCAANATECQAGKLALCNANGLAWSLTDCASGAVCDQGKCKAPICKAGDKTCNGNVVQQCDAKGLAQTVLADCAKTGQVCSNGSCVTLLCAPNTTSCQNGQIAICASSGLDWIKIDCPAGKVCDQGQCKDTVCAPGSKQCADKVVQTCDAKGLGYTNGQDCAKTSQVCDKGVCKSLVCTPNSASCQGGQLALCLNDGLSWYLTDCVSGKVCDQGQCKTTICTPGAKACNGNVAEQCDAKGLNMVVTADCDKSKQTCEAGVCKTPICTPKATECQAGKLAVCADNALSWQQSACGTNQVCDAGQCKDQICKPDSSFCNGFEVSKCDAKGLNATKVVDCSAGKQACANGACVASACWPPGSQKCAGPQVATCKADASGYDLLVCNDNDACTSNACDDKTVKCFYFTVKDCADSDICTNDGCDKQTGACFNTPFSGSCDDGDGCTTGETCATGKCLPPVGYTITTLAGSEKSGTADGPAAQAQFAGTYGLARKAGGGFWVADGNRIRKLTAGGDVVTVVGSTGTGSTDGPPDKALFNNVQGLAVDGGGYLYVADRSNSRIRKVAPDGYVTTWSGGSGAGYLDGTVADAKFSSPSELAFDKASGWLYVLDTGNRRLRAVKPDGQAITVCGSGSSGYADGACSSAKFGYLESMAVLPDGSIAVYDYENYRIRLVKPDATVTTLAGSGASGFQDGAASSAKFTYIHAMVAGPDGELYLADQGRVRLLVKDEVKTIAGGGTSKSSGDALSFSLLGTLSLAWDDNEALVVGDSYALRLLTPKSAVLCDDLQACTADSCDKATGKCVFKPLSAGAKCDDFSACTTTTTCDGKGACTGPAKNCDDSNSCTWDGCDALTGACDNHPTVATCSDGDACTPADTCVAGKCVVDQAVVVTVAGSGSTGWQDGTAAGAKIGHVTSMVVDGEGALWMSDQASHVLRRMTADGKVTTEAGQAAKPGYTDGDAASAQFKSLHGLALDNQGRLVIGDYGNHRVRLYDPSTKKVTTLAGSGSPSYADGPASSAGFSSPGAIAVDSAGAIFVFDTSNYRIRRIANGAVTTVAGSGASGKQDGAASSATFSTVYTMAFAKDGTLWLADSGAHSIRKLAGGTVTTVVGNLGAGYVDGPVAQAKVNGATGLAIDAVGQVIIADLGNRRIRRINQKGILVTDTGSGSQAWIDGLGTSAAYLAPNCVAAAGVGSVYLHDQYRIRKSTASPIDCDDGKQCTLDKCDAKTGQCSNTPIPNGGACEDGDLCTVNEACTDSACKGGVPKSCDDNNSCTADSCEPAKGCVHSGSGLDGNACGGGNFCDAGKCAPSPCGATPPAVAQKGVYVGSVLSMETHGHGGGYSPKHKEYWYPGWAGTTVYRHAANGVQLGTFDSGQSQMMQLWGDIDGTYYLATWGWNTIVKKADKSSTTLWTYAMGQTAGAVCADSANVYALATQGNVAVVLDKDTGKQIGNVPLIGAKSDAMYGGLAVVANTLFVGTINGSVTMHEKGTGKLIDSFTVQGTNIYNMAFNGKEYCTSPNTSAAYCHTIVKPGTGCP